ncbi:anti sigma factor C-terminal domain-containing protein [Metasolibacillus meyeri]|uniref:Anti sigma factor C-terminal domain-containing protein n=1 Tax=Metasolibacillus meyeri TaxID=1071052 RepID=A0AAW9NNL0_9BACL|nr:anti sigma factor C-terminal domain-containing protein [Metasolibacillus meyeri]MEC1180424.1 anti sigma factor C-terminal domain-containing protein [Metasolibacillus meyeri]
MEESLQKALKKAKRKHLIMIIIVSLVVMLVSLPIIYKVFYTTSDYFAAKGSEELQDNLFLWHAITEPNVQISSQITQSSIFGGTVVTSRSKNINGYVVPWSTLTSTYGWKHFDIDYNELVPDFYLSDESYYVYDKQTKNKVATFFHPDLKGYFTEIPNDIAAVSTMGNYVAEMAISFDRPYTVAEIEAMIPENLNIVWLYMTSAVQDENTDPSGIPVYGFNANPLSEKTYADFVKDLAKYALDKNDEVIQTFLQENKDKAFKDLPALGVMLTGQAKNFAALEGETFVRAASVGATVQMVPYIKPKK